MSSNPVIAVDNITKIYRIYETPENRLKEFIFPRIQKLLGASQKKYSMEFQAIKKLSLRINRGETVGIMGKNGSGKSTLLQLISGITAPSSGEIYVNGRVVPLLELGSGFNHEFSGLENIFLNAAVLGLKRSEISRLLDQIIEFADIGDFINQPVKTYSSGMVMRLAFSVAINVTPDILILDEILAVGDELFQRKCLSRIENLKSAGTTILLVSHGVNQITGLCDRAIVLNDGIKIFDGEPKDAISTYHELLYSESVSENKETSPAAEGLKGGIKTSNSHYDPNFQSLSRVDYDSRGALIKSPGIYDCNGDQVNTLLYGQTYSYVYWVEIADECKDAAFGMMIKTKLGIEIGGFSSAKLNIDNLQDIDIKGQYRVEFKFRCLLNAGTYYLNAGVFGDIEEYQGFLHRILDAVAFKVDPFEDNRLTGLVDFNFSNEFIKLGK